MNAIPDWRDIDADQQLHKLFENEMVTTSNIDFCRGIMSKKDYDNIIDAIGMLQHNTPLKSWNPHQRYINMWVATKYIEIYGNNVIVKELRDFLTHCGGDPFAKLLQFIKKYVIGVDVHSDFTIKDENINGAYNHVDEVILNAPIGTTNYFIASIFNGMIQQDLTTREARERLVIFLKEEFDKFKSKKDEYTKKEREAREAIVEISKKIKSKKMNSKKMKEVKEIDEDINEEINELDNKLDAISSETTLLTENQKAEETLKIASQVEDSHTVAEVLSQSSPFTQSLSQMQDTLKYYMGSFSKILNKSDEYSRDLKDLYKTYEQNKNSFMILTDPRRALFRLGAMTFEGTHDNTGKNFVAYPDVSLEHVEEFKDSINLYISYSYILTHPGISSYQTQYADPFFNIDSGIMYNLWGLCRNTIHGWQTPSFMWLLFLNEIYKKNGNIVPDNLVPTFFSLLVDNFTAKNADNFCAMALRNEKNKSNMISSSLYELLNSVKSKISIMIGSCLGKPGGMLNTDFVASIKSFLPHIPEERTRSMLEQINARESNTFSPPATPEHLVSPPQSQSYSQNSNYGNSSNYSAGGGSQDYYSDSSSQPFQVQPYPAGGGSKSYGYGSDGYGSYIPLNQAAFRKGTRKGGRPKKNKRTRRTKSKAKHTRKR